MTAPLDWDAEIRRYVPGPGVYLIEAEQAAGLAEGWLAERTRTGREVVRAGRR